MLIEGIEYDYVTRTSQNQGILQTTGFVNKENINPAGTWSLGLLQMDFFYREKPWYAGQFVRKITPKIKINKKSVVFFSTLLNKQKERLLSILVRNVDNVFRNTKISLPVKKDREIDFAFMEDFISQLEACRLSQLEAYLLVTGLKNYTLTPAEEQALTDFQNGNIKWGEFLIGDLFEKLNLRFLKQKFDKEKDISKEQTTEFDLPLINAKDGNNGIMYYGRSCDFESAEMAIDIVNDGAVSTGNVYPQPQKTGVLYNAYLVKPLFPVTERLLYFFSASIQKSIKPKFGYENKAGWTKVKEEKIFLPIQREEINFEYMETLISAVQKLVIKDVVEYTDRKIEATREIIHKK